MGASYTIDFKFAEDQGEDAIAKAVKSLNEASRASDRVQKSQKAMSQVHQELASYAKKEKQEIFDRLPTEEKINRLLERREQIAHRLAQAGENEARRAALELQRRRNEANLRNLQGQAPSGALDGAKSTLQSKLLGAIPGGQYLEGFVGKIGLGSLAAATAGLFGFKKAMNIADDLSDLTDRLDMTYSGLQRLAYSAKATGGDFNQFREVLEKVHKSQSLALEGNEAMLKEFSSVGITLRELRTLSPDELFYRLTEQIKNGSAGAANFSATLRIMGNTAKEIMPSIKAGIKDAAEEFDRFGLAIGSGALRNVNALQEGLVKAWSIVKQIGAKALFEGIGPFDGVSSYVNKARTAVAALATVAGKVTGSKTLKDFGEDLQTETILTNDKDYQAGLDREKAGEAMLAQRQEVNRAKKEQEEEARRKADEERQKLHSGAKAQPETDQFSRIGLFVGKGYDPTRETGQKQVLELQRINTRLESLEGRIAKFG